MSPEAVPIDIRLWSGFTRRIMAVLLGAGLVVGGLLTLASTWKQKKQWEGFLQLRGRSLVQSLGRAAFAPLVLEDTAALKVLADGFKEEKHVVYAAIYGADGKILSQSPDGVDIPLGAPPDGDLSERRVFSSGPAAVYDLMFPLRYSPAAGSELSGYVRIGLTEEPIRREIRSVVLGNLALCLGLTAAAFLVGAFLVQRMTHQMMNLIEKVQMAEALRESEEKIRALNVSLQERAAQLEAANKELETFS